MRRVAWLLAALSLAGCAAEPGEQTFAVPCGKLANGSIAAQHDFGTTDAATLARVTAFLEGVTIEISGGAAGGDAVSVFPAFSGSVAFVACVEPNTETVVFVLGAP